jgi:hypothetical protein
MMFRTDINFPIIASLCSVDSGAVKAWIWRATEGNDILTFVFSYRTDEIVALILLLNLTEP